MNPYLTRQGRWLLASALFMLVTGVAATEPMLVLLGLGQVLLLALALLSCLPAAAALDRRVLGLQWQGAPSASAGTEHGITRAVTDQEIPLVLRVENPAALGLGRVRLRPFSTAPLAWITPAMAPRDIGRAQAVELELTVRPERMGRWMIHGADVTVGDPFGMFENTDYLPAMHALECLPRPCTGPGQDALAVLGRQVPNLTRRHARAHAPGEEFHQVRPYQPGDALRDIVWKASLRSGRLVSRQYDPDQRHPVLFVLDTSSAMRASGPGPDKLEHMAALVCSAARTLVRAGHPVGLWTVDARLVGELLPSSAASHPLRIARHLAGLTATVDADLTEVDDAGLIRILAEYLRVHERLDFGRVGVAARRSGVNEPLLERWLHGALARERSQGLPESFGEGRLVAVEGVWRAFAQQRGLALPYRAQTPAGPRAKALVEALNRAARQSPSPARILLVTDLVQLGGQELGGLAQALGLLLAQGHRPGVVVPFGPSYMLDAAPGPVAGLFVAQERRERLAQARTLAVQGADVHMVSAKGHVRGVDPANEARLA